MSASHWKRVLKKDEHENGSKVVLSSFFLNFINTPLISFSPVLVVIKQYSSIRPRIHLLPGATENAIQATYRPQLVIFFTLYFQCAWTLHILIPILFASNFFSLVHDVKKVTTGYKVPAKGWCPFISPIPISSIFRPCTRVRLSKGCNYELSEQMLIRFVQEGCSNNFLFHKL